MEELPYCPFLDDKDWLGNDYDFGFDFDFDTEASTATNAAMESPPPNDPTIDWVDECNRYGHERWKAAASQRTPEQRPIPNLVGLVQSGGPGTGQPPCKLG